MSWQQYRAEAKIIEKNFAKNLTDPTWANDYQDMHEHWDVQGTLDGKLLKFDIKGMKKVNRQDNKKQHDILIFCDPYFDQYDELQFQEKIDFYNKTYNRRDVYFMGFHPNNPATVEEQEFLVNPTDDDSQYESDLGYSMMLIQKFKQLYDASCKLHKIGYYKKWPKEYYEEVVAERQRTYEQLNKKR